MTKAEAKEIAEKARNLLLSIPDGQLREYAIHELELCMSCGTDDRPAWQRGVMRCQCWNDE